MPTVPTYDGLQVQQQAIPSARVSTDAPVEAFGGGATKIAEAAKAPIAAVEKYADDQLEQFNKVRLVQARTDMNGIEQSLIHDPKTGALATQGQNAFGTPEQVSESFDKWSSNYEQNLSNQDQKIGFRSMAQARKEAMMSRVNDHVAQQAKVVQAGTYDAAIESSKERASTDPTYAPIETKFIEQSVDSRAAVQGWTPEIVQQEKQKNISDLHARIVNGMLTRQQDLAASRYFNAVKDSIDPDTQTKLVGALDEGSLRRVSQQSSDEILRTTKDESQAVTLARQIEEPKVRDEVERRVRQNFQEAKVAETARQEKVFQTATNIVEQSKNFDAVPSNVVAAMPLSHRTALRSYADELAKGKKPQTDWTLYYNLRTQATSPELQDKFAQTDLLQYRDKLADEKFSELIGLQGGIRTSDAKTTQKLDGFRTDQGIINDALNASGIDSTPKPGSADATRVAEIRRRVEEMQVDHQQKTGKKATNADIQGFVDKQLIEDSNTRGWLFGAGKKFYESDPTKFKADIKSVPAGERRLIENKLRGAGRPVTDSEVLRLFRLKNGVN